MLSKRQCSKRGCVAKILISIINRVFWPRIVPEINRRLFNNSLHICFHILSSELFATCSKFLCRLFQNYTDCSRTLHRLFQNSLQFLLRNSPHIIPELSIDSFRTHRRLFQNSLQIDQELNAGSQHRACRNHKWIWRK